MKLIKGFTLIELLVVIAIIGILSSVVLAQLNTSRLKGADASVRSNLNNARSQMEVYYAVNGQYNCGDSKVTSMVSAAGGSCSSNASGTWWIADAPLRVQNQVSGSSGIDYWCVDSRGAGKIEDAGKAVGAQFCL